MVSTQSNSFFRFFVSSALVLTLGVLAGCKSAPKKDDVVSDATNSDISSVPLADYNTMGDSDSGKAGGLQTIYFPYDSFVLDRTADGILTQNAEILKAKPSFMIQIEGHCDSRGGVQYNIALGEKRANAVKRALMAKGIASNRIATISYGKERLVASGESEDAHSKNRRANFVITSK
jgi:peptidoglycan-associated lipoprotein